MAKQTTIVVIGALRVKISAANIQFWCITLHWANSTDDKLTIFFQEHSL